MLTLALRSAALAGLLFVVACSAPEAPPGGADAGPVDNRSPAKIGVDLAALEFGALAVGGTASRDLTVSNLGQRDLVLDAAHVRLVQSAERPFYNLVASEERVIKGGETKTWRLDYTPIFGGRDIASLQLDNGGEITTVTLSGEGIAADSAIILKSAQVTLGSTTSPATSAKYTLEGSVGLGVEAVEMKNADVKLRFGSR